MTTITLRQAQKLIAFFGSHDCEVTIGENLPGHPPGLYAWCTEYPDEGCDYLGPTEVDDELAANGTDWAQDLGRLQDGDVELLEDAIEALLQPNNAMSREHALHGLQRRVQAAKALADGSAADGDLRVDDEQVMRIWRAAGLPESFLGNGGSNGKLIKFTQLVRDASGAAPSQAPSEPAWWGGALNRRATVEQWMFDAARGKRPMPTPDELRAWAIKLGTPEPGEPASGAPGLDGGQKP
jgi:hypothetical protein